MDGKPIEIVSAEARFEPEPLVVPFGFKGRYVSELWQVAVRLETSSGRRCIGLGTQSVLWSDQAVFAANTPEKGNELMYSLTKFALSLAKGRKFSSPLELLDYVLEDTLDYGRRLTGMPKLRKTFALNSLVALDMAAWQAYALENEISTFDRMVPVEFRDALSSRHDKVVRVPVVGYGMPGEAVMRLIDEGAYILKIKLGFPGSQTEMLEADTGRIAQIHHDVGQCNVSTSPMGRVLYYLDCNGRYESMEIFLRLVDYLERSGIAPRVLLVEEPFGEDAELDVSEVPLKVAADESAHTAADTRARIQMGYGAIALKPVAKTLSETLRIAKVAHQAGVPSFCADLTVNPILAEWNRNVAARLEALPGLEAGLMETNGDQFYAAWERMTGYHPAAGKAWIEASEGVYCLDDEFYTTGGGIFSQPEHYSALFG